MSDTFVTFIFFIILERYAACSLQRSLQYGVQYASPHAAPYTSPYAAPYAVPYAVRYSNRPIRLLVAKRMNKEEGRRLEVDQKLF